MYEQRILEVAQHNNKEIITSIIVDLSRIDIRAAIQTGNIDTELARRVAIKLLAITDGEQLKTLAAKNQQSQVAVSGDIEK